MMRALVKVQDWFDSLLHLGAVRQSLAQVRVPVHRWSFFSALGGMTLVLLGMQVVSGVLLLLYYRPTVEEAHRSVELIAGEVPFGDLIRSVHVWSGDLFVAMLIAHIFSVLIQRSYRKPRETVWLTGSLLLIMSVGLALSGHLLPWSQSAYLAARVSTELSAKVPFVGHFLQVFLRGGEELTARSLGRFYGFHVAILPAAVTLLVAAHLWLINRHGLSLPRSLETKPVPRVPYYPHIALRDWARATALLLIVLTLATLLPRGLDSEADPLAAAPAEVRPQWYFLWVFQLLKVLPSRLLGVPGDVVGVSILLITLGAFCALPWIDRRGSRVMFYVGLVAAFAFVGATFHGLR